MDNPFSKRIIYAVGHKTNSGEMKNKLGLLQISRGLAATWVVFFPFWDCHTILL
jgi:hypothetical protein